MFCVLSYPNFSVRENCSFQNMSSYKLPQQLWVIFVAAWRTHRYSILVKHHRPLRVSVMTRDLPFISWILVWSYDWLDPQSCSRLVPSDVLRWIRLSRCHDTYNTGLYLYALIYIIHLLSFCGVIVDKLDLRDDDELHLTLQRVWCMLPEWITKYAGLDLRFIHYKFVNLH